MKQRIFSWVAAFSLLTSGLLAGPHSAQAMEMAATTEPSPSIAILLDGYPLLTQPAPLIYNGRTMVPFRSLVDALGVQVDWDASTRTVIAHLNNREIRLQIGNKTAYLDGKATALDAEPIIVQDHTLIPLRFLAESIGATVGWDDKSRRVIIQSEPRHLHTTVFYGLGSYANRFYLPKFDQATFTWSEWDAKGHVVFNEGDYYWPEGAEDLLTEVKQAGVDTSLMVYGNDDKGVLTQLLQDGTLQTQFISDVVTRLKEKGMSGATLDLEDLGPSVQGEDLTKVQTQYAAFIQKVADALHENGKKLTVCVSPLNGWYKGYDYTKLAQAADHLYVMAYDYVPTKEPQPIDDVDMALQMATSVVDPSKLELGINLYGEDEESVREKVGLAKRYNVSGVGFWILPLMTDSYMQTLNTTLVLRTATLQEPPATDGTGGAGGMGSTGASTGTGGTTGTGTGGNTGTSTGTGGTGSTGTSGSTDISTNTDNTNHTGSTFTNSGK